MRRRTLLAALGGGTITLAGCLSEATPDQSDDTDLPADCPTTQGLDVEWPRDLDAATVESFVEDYEHAYYRDVVVEYEPESRLDAYELSGSVTGGPRAVGDGWVLEYSGSGGVYRPTLLLGASPDTPPAGVEPVPIEDIDDGPLVDTLREAAETGEAEMHVERRHDGAVERYLALLSSLSADFEGPSSRGDSDSLYVDVDGTTVKLTVSASSFHGDYWWEAGYYVTERVVRRTDDTEADPRQGGLLECRTG